MKKRYVVFGVLVAAIVAAAYLSLPRASRTKKPETIGALAQELGLAFPPSTRMIGVHRSSGMDDRVAVKLEMKADDVPAFLSSAQVDPSTMSAGAVAYFGMDRDFWDPNRARGFRAVQVRREKTFRTLNVGISEPQDGFTAVYVVEHGD